MIDHILSLSYGKDSMACLFAIEQMGLPLDRIIHAEVWATDTISADLPPMVEFKEKADKIIKEWFGIEVEHIRASKSYEDYFYQRVSRGKRQGEIYGFPMLNCPWCNSRLKVSVLGSKRQTGKDAIRYLGIAADEPDRIERHTKDGIILPLVEIGWDEAYCRKLCEENGLLSPIYVSANRGGCWFCHNQGVEQLRKLRRMHPELWKILLKWDKDSPVLFKADGRTVHDYDRRFQLEDEGIIFPNERFLWRMLDEPIQIRLF